MKEYRTTKCSLVSEKDIDRKIKLSGFVENIRDHGGITFVDLRDESGIMQLVSNEDIFNDLTKESVITVDGAVRKRDEDDYNNNITTGTIEILVSKMEIISKAKALPFEIKTSLEVNEELRLKYRYLDLRNKKVHDNVLFRGEVLKFLRNKMDCLGFTEVQTPIISSSSPEGARDFIIPSRKYHGKFYALPQAPQIYKQLLMASGFEKYYQIAPCFRDEDCRADRALEFYQLDFEMSFVTEEDVEKVGEKILYSVFKNFSNKKVSSFPFVKIPYKEAILKYGTDKPDLRNPLEIIELSSIFKNSNFKPFNGVTVRGIKVEGISNKPNSWFNELSDYASSIGLPGIGYITVNDDMTFKGPIDKFLTEEERSFLINKAELKKKSVLFFVANKQEKMASKQAGLIRTELANKLGLIDENKIEFCIINDFPMYEYNEDSGVYEFAHNPFSMPKGGLESLKEQDLNNIIAYQYDLVCNGNEMASGAVRNHDISIMEEAFRLVGYSKEEVKKRFKSLHTAFQYGVPPHAGMALGIDRIIMLLKDETNLREVQAFPMSVSGIDNMMSSPNEVTELQLRETHIKIR